MVVLNLMWHSNLFLKLSRRITGFSYLILHSSERAAKPRTRLINTLNAENMPIPSPPRKYSFSKRLVYEAAVWTNKCKSTTRNPQGPTRSVKRRTEVMEVRRATFKPPKGKAARADSPVLVRDQLFPMETDEKRREAHSQARGWDGGQSARAPGTTGLAGAPARRLIPWPFARAERGTVWCGLPACARTCTEVFRDLITTNNIHHPGAQWKEGKSQSKCGRSRV